MITKLLGFMGAIVIVIIVIIMMYRLHKKTVGKIDFLKTCNLSVLSLEELQRWQIWLHGQRKSFSTLLLDRTIGIDSGKINPNIFEIEKKIEEELIRRIK